jgi:hypothetical protein
MIMQYTFKKGIAMIELIFSIVIMGIVLSSAPMLVSQSTSSSLVAFQQESIAIVSSHINTLSTYAWDEENTNLKSPNSLLNVASGNTELLQQDGTTKRGSAYALTFAANRLRRYSDVNISLAVDAVGTLGADGNLTVIDTDDDIDDFIVNPLVLINDGTGNQANQGEYMDSDITIATTVTYGFDQASSYTNVTGVFAFSQPFTNNGIAEDNIKLITVTLTTNEASLSDKNIALRAFMCNIGAARSQDRAALY